MLASRRGGGVAAVNGQGYAPCFPVVGAFKVYRRQTNVGDNMTVRMPKQIEVDRSFEFHKLEYVALREEIKQSIAENDKIVYFSVVASGAIAAWLSTKGIDYPRIFWAGPLAASSIGGVLFYQKALDMMHAGKYISKIENMYADPDLKGWESELEHHGNARVLKIKNLILLLFWIVFIFITLIFLGMGLYPEFLL